MRLWQWSFTEMLQVMLTMLLGLCIHFFTMPPGCSTSADPLHPMVSKHVVWTFLLGSQEIVKQQAFDPNNKTNPYGVQIVLFWSCAFRNRVISQSCNVSTTDQPVRQDCDLARLLSSSLSRSQGGRGPPARANEGSQGPWQLL